MLEIDYIEEKGGWQSPVISPFHNLSIDPRNSSLHYAIQLFEGTSLEYNVFRIKGL